MSVNINSRLTKYIVASVIFFAWVTIQGAIQAQQPIHDFLVGPAAIIVGAHVHIGTLGWISLTLMALIYYLLPLVSGKAIIWPGLINLIFWIFAPLTAIQSIIMITVGIRAGNAVASGMAGPQVGALMGPYMMVIGILSLLCGAVSLLFVVQIITSAMRR